MRRVTRLLDACLSVSSQRSAKSKKLGEEAGASAIARADLFTAIRDEWDNAEKVIKLAEQVTADVVIPAVQELRYAGRRLIDALNADACGEPPECVRAFIEDARFSCHRARHDAIDAAISLMSIDADLLARKMGYDIVHSSFPDYLNFVQRLDEARARIAESRANRHDRDAIYAAITQGDFPGLVLDYKALRRSELLMRIIIGRKKVGLWSAIVLGVLGYALSGYFWAYPRAVPAASETSNVQVATPGKDEPPQKLVTTPAANTPPPKPGSGAKS